MLLVPGMLESIRQARRTKRHESTSLVSMMEMPEYVVSSNVRREQIGLRTIKKSWLLLGGQEGERFWCADGRDQRPIKCVQRDRTTGWDIWEMDTYRSGRKVKNPIEDGMMDEFLKFTYCYTNNTVHIWCVTDDEEIAKRMVPFTDYTTNFAAATAATDWVLAKWGQSRL
jgi:hypothetical protein